MNDLTLLQSLYWQKVSLQDAAWNIRRRITNAIKRNHLPKKLMARLHSIDDEINSIATQMAIIEALTA